MDCAAWSFDGFHCEHRGFFSFLFFSSPHLTSLLSVAIHSEQNTHLNKQQQPIWLSITFSFASAACGRWCCRCCPFHTPTHLYKLYELFWFEFCLSSLHTHSANSSALLHYSFALALTLTYSLLSLFSATLRFVRCAGALACSRMCAFGDFFSLLLSLIASLVRSLFRSVRFLCMCVLLWIKHIPKQRYTEKHIQWIKRERKKSQAHK